MPTELQVSRLLRDITRQTVEGQLEWSAAGLPASLRRGTSDIVDDYYEARYKGQDIAVYERKFEAYDAERDTGYWSSDARFALLRDNAVIWDTSDDPARIWSLLKVARESAADVESLFKTLLDKTGAEEDS